MKGYSHWGQIRNEYIFGTQSENGGIGFLTLEELARKYNLRADTVRRRAAKERWREQREEFFLEIIKRTRAALTKRVMQRLASAYECAIDGALETMQLGRALLRPVVENLNELDKTDIKKLDEVAEIALDAQRMHSGGWATLRSALGDLLDLVDQEEQSDQDVIIEEYIKRVLRVADPRVAELIVSEAPAPVVREMVTKLVEKHRPILVDVLEAVLVEEQEREINGDGNEMATK